MFLERVSVKNFRSLKDIEIKFSETTVLIGENNTGKTSVLDILRLCLNKRNYNIFSEYDYFGNLFEDVVESDGISIVFTFKERRPSEWNEHITRDLSTIFQPFIDKYNETMLYQIHLRVYSIYNPTTKEFDLGYECLNNDNQKVTSSTEVINKLLKYNPIFYLKALRDVNENFSSNSLMWGKFLKKIKFSDEDLIDLKKNIESLNADIISKDANLSSLVNSMNSIDKILDFQGGNSIEVNALPIKSWDLLSKAQLLLKSSEGFSLPLEKYGQGTQSISIILLYKSYIEIMLEKMYTKYSEAILTLEEPEAHLHPQAIKAFEFNLKNIDSQKIITTHSPYFLQNIDLRSIRLLRKSNGESIISSIITELFIEINQTNETINRIVEVNNSILSISNNIIKVTAPILSNCQRALLGYFNTHEPEKIDELNVLIKNSLLIFTNAEYIKLDNFLKRTRGEILFSRGWLLAEGPTEYVILSYFANVIGKNLDENGISYIDYRNNGSAGLFAKLARVFEFNWVLLSDNDTQGINNKREILSSGYIEDEISNVIYFTEKKDIEAELVYNGFLNDYEVILNSEITQELIELKQTNLDLYKDEIIKIIQSGTGKIQNSHKLVEQLTARGMARNEIPTNIVSLLERLLNDE